MSNENQTKICKYCKEEIDKDSNWCTQCGKNLQENPALKYSLIVASIIIFIVIVAVSYQEASEKADQAVLKASLSNKGSVSSSSNKNQEYSTAFKLASIEAGTYPSSSLISSFENLLSRLKIKCPSKSEEQIADLVVKTQELLGDKGIKTTLLEIGNNIDLSIPKEMAGSIKCEEVAAALITLTTK